MMKKLLLLCLSMAAMSLFLTSSLFAQGPDTLRTDTLWYDDFNDGDFTSNYQWNLVDWFGTTTGDASSGKFVIKTSVSGTGVIAYSFGNGWTDLADYTIKCKARISGALNYGDFQVSAKQDLAGTKNYTVSFVRDYGYGAGIWIYEAISSSYLVWGYATAIKPDTFFNVKVTVAGDVILAKAWNPDSTEPDWQAMYTLANIPYKDLWRGIQVGGYYIDSVTVDDVVVYGPPYCDYPAGDVNGDNANPSLQDVIWLAKHVLGFPGYPLNECPNGR